MYKCLPVADPSVANTLTLNRLDTKLLTTSTGFTTKLFSLTAYDDCSKLTVAPIKAKTLLNYVRRCTKIIL